MKFGKLQDISTVDFTLPPDDKGTSYFLNKLPKRTAVPQLYVGCTGWSMKEWLGKVYPKTAKAKDFLYHYSRQFNTIELNTTHYRIPNEKTIQKWKNESADDFKFCPKIPQSISHSRDLGYGSGLILSFCNAIQGLEEKLGCCFMQLPPYFGADRLPLLTHFLSNFPTHIPLSIEVRHESWFHHPDNSARLFDTLEHYKVSPVITDVAGRRDVLHNRLTTDTVLLRFVGNALHPTDYSRIDAWLQRFQTWFDHNLKTIYCFTHEPDNILAPDLALYMVEQAQQQTNAEVRGPTFISPTNGQQMSLF